MENYNIIKLIRALSSMTGSSRNAKTMNHTVIQDINWYLQLRMHIKIQSQFPHGKLLMNDVGNFKHKHSISDRSPASTKAIALKSWGSHAKIYFEIKS